MQDRCALIPAFNEAKTIGGLVSYLSQHAIDVVVIDDCSKDDTRKIAEENGAYVIHHAQQSGKGKALKDGIEYIKNKRYEFVVFMDADGQHDPEEIFHFFEHARLYRADVIVGNRMWNPHAMPLVRRLTNRFLSALISMLCQQRIEDSQCGYRCLRKRVVDALHISSSNFEVESEMLVTASRLGYKIHSIPIRVIYAKEISKVHPIVDTWRFIFFFFKVLFKKKS